MATGRSILAVVAGAVTWAFLWVGGTLAAGAVWPGVMAPGQPVTHTGALAGLVAYSVVLSVLAGFVTARVGAGSQRAVLALAVLQLLLGIGIEASAWSMTPVWYHLVFLALLVPATLYGGRVRGATRPAPATAFTASTAG